MRARLLVLVALLLGGCLSITLPESAEVDVDAERKVCLGVTLRLSKRFAIEPAAPP
jgi:hypothetical protein